MDFNDWFDVSNISHVRAFEQMQIHGKWPEGSLPEDIRFRDGWMGIALTQLADAYIDYMNALCP